MRKDNLKNVMRVHIEKKSLSDKQLESLLQLQTKKVKNESRSLNFQYRWLAVAAVFFLVLGNLFYFSISPFQTKPVTAL